MDIQGKLIHLLPLQTGEGKNGTWKKQDIVIETKGQYPKKVCISIWGDKINPSILKVGSELSLGFDAESREYNGRWYTELRAWKIDLLADQSSMPSSSEAFLPEAGLGTDESDLPF